MKLTTYDFIAENKRKTIALIVLFPIAFALSALIFIFILAPFIMPETAQSQSQSMYNFTTWQMTLYYASYTLPICAVVAALWIFISYFTGDKMMLRMAHAEHVDQKNFPQLYNMVETIAITAGMPTPKIYVINEHALNAFATGRSPESASIVFTSGIIEKLDKHELEAVAAHEMAHIMNRDIRLMLITVAGISFFSIVGGIILRAGLRARMSGKASAAKLVIILIGLFFIFYGYIIAPLIRLALSRQREYQADATAALLMRNPGALASALEKISGNSSMDFLKTQPAMAPMCIDAPPSAGIFDKLSGITATHPPIEKRIQALREMDGQN